MVSDDFTETMRVADVPAIFTTEEKVVDLALDLNTDCVSSNKFVIFSDSFSVLKPLDHTSSKNRQIQKLLEKHHDLAECNKIVYCWIPSHIGIDGNENVDQKQKFHSIYNLQIFCNPIQILNLYLQVYCKQVANIME